MFPFSTFANRFIPLFVKVLLTLDPACLAPLKDHHGKVFSFQIEGCPSLFFRITEQGFDVVDSQPCDVTFSGPMHAFMKTLFSKQRIHTGLHIKGELALAKALDDCWQNLNIDWEAHLAKAFGDNLAHLLMQTLKGTKQYLGDVWQARTEDLGAFLQDETQLLPSQEEANAFYKEVDSLRHDVDRFAAKVQLLQQRISKSKE